MEAILQGYDNEAFGGSVVAPLKKFDYAIRAQIEKDKTALAKLLVT